MTRLPTESRDYKGLAGPGYESFKVGPLCSVPGCGRPADHSHHVVRRSELGGPFLWVRMPDGAEVGNITGLCWRHHNEVTENKTTITYADKQFFWEGELLTPQPPIKDLNKDELEEAWGKVYAAVAAVDIDAVKAERGLTHVEDHDREVCPTCNRKLPKPKIETPNEEKKPRGTWAIAIPLDERENGADTLDALLEAAREELDKVGISYGDGSKVKFYTLSTTLGIFVQQAGLILSDD